MNVVPSYNAVGNFFRYKPIYQIPKYQRGYAWDKLELDDFLKDLENCFHKRISKTNINHFFGGIVSVTKAIPGAINQNSYELVDGQQRMATFVILVSCIIGIYKELLHAVIISGDAKNQKIIEGRIKDLTNRFIEFEQEINRNTSMQDVLTLSKADKDFFKDLIAGGTPASTRDSHTRIKNAYDAILGKIRTLINATSITDRLDRLETINNVIDIDFSILHVVTDNKNEAYRLFQVLNDRGKSLTEGDLLRAKTLELLENHPRDQALVEAIWDDILSDKPNLTEDYLRWIYASHKGQRAGSSTLFDDFLDFFFPAHKNSSVSATNAKAIQTKCREVQVEISRCRKLIGGEWPFSQAQPITSWDRNRLSLLVKELGHTLCMPLLLAACLLDHKIFSELIQLVERFVFRYIIVSNQHATPLVAIYHEEALLIRKNPGTYNLNSLKRKLIALGNSKAPDGIFIANLNSLNYKVGGGNKSLKYFLMTVEYYLRWYKSGARGTPKCLDKSLVYDFIDTTIEHIYPRNAAGATIDATIEDLKNTLGNLTVMGPNDNVTGANDNFARKKPIYATSSVLMNRDLSLTANLSKPEIQKRKNELDKMALKIFKV